MIIHHTDCGFSYFTNNDQVLASLIVRIISILNIFYLTVYDLFSIFYIFLYFIGSNRKKDKQCTLLSTILQR
jgi:hypothetical protein